MNTAVTVVDTISRTVVELAFIGAGLKLLLTIAPGLRLTAAPRASQPKREAEVKAPADAKVDVVPFERAG